MNPKSIVVSNINSGKYTYDSMSEYLGITKPTLYARIAKDNWKKGELVLILRLR